LAQSGHAGRADPKRTFNKALAGILQPRSGPSEWLLAANRRITEMVGS
jgi:hypothetical protein